MLQIVKDWSGLVLVGMDTGGIPKNISDYERMVRTGVGWHRKRRNTDECFRL